MCSKCHCGLGLWTQLLCWWQAGGAMYLLGFFLIHIAKFQWPSMVFTVFNRVAWYYPTVSGIFWKPPPFPPLLSGLSQPPATSFCFPNSKIFCILVKLVLASSNPFLPPTNFFQGNSYTFTNAFLLPILHSKQGTHKLKMLLGPTHSWQNASNLPR